MKKKKNWIITITFLAFVIAFAQVTKVAGKSKRKADTTTLEEYAREKNRKILAGLQGVGVMMEDFRPEAEKYGFNKQQYKTDVELRLRQYGVKVLSQKEKLQASGYPYLYINVNPLINEKIGLAAMSISVQLKEMVLLERNRTIRDTATTWNKGKTLLYGLHKLDKTRDDVRDLVDMFINDYLAANPKDQPSKKDSTTKTIPQTYVVPKNALLDMLACAEINRLASDPNLPQEQKAEARKRGLELLVIQKVYLYDNLGLGDEDLATRMRVLLMGLKDKKLGVFDYINFEYFLNSSP